MFKNSRRLLIIFNFIILCSFLVTLIFYFVLKQNNDNVANICLNISISSFSIFLTCGILELIKYIDNKKKLNNVKINVYSLLRNLIFDFTLMWKVCYEACNFSESKMKLKDFYTKKEIAGVIFRELDLSQNVNTSQKQSWFSYLKCCSESFEKNIRQIELLLSTNKDFSELSNQVNYFANNNLLYYLIKNIDIIENSIKGAIPTFIHFDYLVDEKDFNNILYLIDWCVSTYNVFKRQNIKNLLEFNEEIEFDTTAPKCVYFGNCGKILKVVQTNDFKMLKGSNNTLWIQR